MILTQERLKQLLRYSPVVGVFEKLVGGSRKSRPKRWVLAGGVRRDTGYITISVGGKSYAAHRLAWLYMYGVMPEQEIDHIDGDRSNNAIKNLRIATRCENMWNTASHKNNRSGLKGVSWDKARNMWVGRIKAEGKVAFNAYFKTLEEAEVAMAEARARIHEEFANNGIHGYVAEELLDAG